MSHRSESSPRDRFLAALDRRPLPGRVPTFELNFFLTMEAFGKVNPQHRSYHQWLQMTDRERQAHRQDVASLWIDTAERFDWSAILMKWPGEALDDALAAADLVRDKVGDRLALLMHGDATMGIPHGTQMEAQSLRMAEAPEQVDAEATRRVDAAIARAERIAEHGGIDGLVLCSDYCFNSGPFLPLPWFDRFVAPHLHRLVRAYRSMGFRVIKHTDGNIMPILDRLVPEDETARPHALHSLDPQGGVDLAEVGRLVGDRVALCGNVNCALLQTGTQAQCDADVRRALREGLDLPGYVFGTSNCVYTGMSLERYERMLEIWRRAGERADTAAATAPRL